MFFNRRYLQAYNSVQTNRLKKKTEPADTEVSFFLLFSYFNKKNIYIWKGLIGGQSMNFFKTYTKKHKTIPKFECSFFSTTRTSMFFLSLHTCFLTSVKSFFILHPSIMWTKPIIFWDKGKSYTKTTSF